MFGEIATCPTCKGRGDVAYSREEAHAIRLQVARDDRRAKKQGAAKADRPPARRRCPLCGGSGVVDRETADRGS